MAFPKGSNTANFNNCARWNLQNGNITSVGTNGGTSAYGTRDQSGNVWEWNENTIENQGNYNKILRGGAWNSTTTSVLSSNFSINSSASTKSFNIGFRLVHLSIGSIFVFFVGINDSGNEADTNSKGSVSYDYHIMIHPVTNQEYVEFLNNTDPSGQNLYNTYSIDMTNNFRGGIIYVPSNPVGSKYIVKNNMSNKPVNYVDWFCAARMANWLHNDFGDTESGAYDLTNGTNILSITRNPNAKYAISSENEWYKSAYYKADGLNSGYWLYATQYDTDPSCVISNILGDGPVNNIFPSPTPTLTPSLTPTTTPTNTVTPTLSPTQSLSVSLTPTTTPTITTTPTTTPTHTPTSSITPTLTPTPTVTTTVTTTPTSTSTPTNTISPTKTPTKTPTPTRSVTPTVTPTITTTPSNTPTPSIFTAPQVDNINNMILESMFNIKTYLGSDKLSLLEPKCGDKVFQPGEKQYQLWHNFIDNISTIYSTKSIDDNTAIFWVLPSGNAFVPNPYSSLSELEPGESYYFITREYPDKDIHIPRCLEADPKILCETNICPNINISGINSDNLIISTGLMIPFNISLSGLLDNYSYSFESVDASAPCSIYPLSGIITNRHDQTSEIAGVIEFGFDDVFIQQANLSKLISNDKNIYSVIKLSLNSNKELDNNSCNYAERAVWGGNAGLTTIGLNGRPSKYGIYDMAGQLYEWTDTSPDNKPNHKILRGGSWLDSDSLALSKHIFKNHDIFSVFDDGGFGLRIASYENPDNYNNFIIIENEGNINDPSPESCNLGSVYYSYYIQQNLLTNQEYCDYLNTVDPLGENNLDLYDYRMANHHTGGIALDSCKNFGERYVIKPLMSNKPANFISWIRAAKYCNWLHNNKGWDIYENVPNNSIAQDWVDSNIDLHPDSIVEIQASGTIKFTDVTDINQWTGPEGVNLGELASATCGFDVPQAVSIPVAALVGKIGDNGTIFEIGTGGRYNPEISGRLYLGINDVRCTEDNFGSFDVNIRVYDPATINDKLLVGAYDLRNIIFDNQIYRNFDAKYFIPSHNEWYKAAFYDSELAAYWTYPTQSHDAPQPVLSDSSGNAKNIQTLCPEKVDHIFTVQCDSCHDAKEQYNKCPKILSMTNNIDLSQFEGDHAVVDVVVTGLSKNTSYSYFFDSTDSNWPAHISDKDNVFIANGDTHTISSTFTFVNDKNTNFNLPPVSEKTKDFSKIYNILRFNIAKASQPNCGIAWSESLLKCNKCYSKEFVTDVEFVAPSNRQIEVSGNGCKQYIPIMVDIKNYLPDSYIDDLSSTNNISKEKYYFRFGSDSSNVSFYPAGGHVYVANNARLTSLALLNGNVNVNAFIRLTRESTGATSTDYIALKCAAQCTPTPSPTPVSTRTPTPTPTITNSPTTTPTTTPTVTVSQTVSPSITVSPTVTRTVTPTNSVSATVTPTPLPSRSPTPTQTMTPTLTPTHSMTPTPSVSVSVSATATPTQTISPTVSPSVSVSPIPPDSVISPLIIDYGHNYSTLINSSTMAITITIDASEPSWYLVEGGTQQDGVVGTVFFDGKHRLVINFTDRRPSVVTARNKTGSIKITPINHTNTTDVVIADSFTSTPTSSVAGGVTGISSWISSLKRITLDSLPLLNSVPDYIPKAEHIQLPLCTTFNDPNVMSWDTSSINDMNNMFRGCVRFNIPLSLWDTSNVTNMSRMFQDARAFTGDTLDSWNTGKVTNMSSMFESAVSFRGNISNWDTSQVTNMNSMFYNAGAFTTDINNWNVSNVISMRDMFRLTGYTTKLSRWNASSLKDAADFSILGTDDWILPALLSDLYLPGSDLDNLLIKWDQNKSLFSTYFTTPRPASSAFEYNYTANTKIRVRTSSRGTIIARTIPGAQALVNLRQAGWDI
jgi:surface protein